MSGPRDFGAGWLRLSEAGMLRDFLLLPCINIGARLLSCWSRLLSTAAMSLLTLAVTYSAVLGSNLDCIANFTGSKPGASTASS